MAGLKRKHQFNLLFSEEENEFVARRAYQEGMSANAWIRFRLFRKNWRKELEELTAGQGNDLNDIDVRRK